MLLVYYKRVKKKVYLWENKQEKWQKNYLIEIIVTGKFIEYLVGND